MLMDHRFCRINVGRSIFDMPVSRGLGRPFRTTFFRDDIYLAWYRVTGIIYDHTDTIFRVVN